MSDRWYYRVFGQEFGPVSLELVRTLVALGTIAPDDEVRAANRSNWILACAASELRSAIKSSDSEPTVERREVRDEWFCRGVAGDFGPLTLSDLIQLAADGELKRDEDIKAKSDDNWKQLCSIPRLIELLPFPELSDQPDSETIELNSKQFPLFDEANGTSGPERTDILLFPGVRSVEQSSLKDEESKISADTAPQENCPPTLETHLDVGDVSNDINGLWQAALFASVIQTPNVPANVFANMHVLFPSEEDRSTDSLDQLEAILEAASAKWTGWIAGEEFGPVEYSELLTWAVTGRLSPMDFVRRGDEGQYVPAVNIPCLFTVRAAANSLSRPVNSPVAYVAERPSINENSIQEMKSDTQSRTTESHLSETKVNSENKRPIRSMLGNLAKAIGIFKADWATRS